MLPASALRRLCALRHAKLDLARTPARGCSVAVSGTLARIPVSAVPQRTTRSRSWQPADLSRWHPAVRPFGSRLVCTAKKGGGVKAPNKQQQQRQPITAQIDSAEDELLSDDDEDEDDSDLSGDFESHDSDDEFGREDQDASPTVALGNVLWGEKAFQACEAALQAEGMQDLELFAFRVNVARKKIGIRLDNLEDYYGSPTLDQVSDFSRAFYSGLEAALGAEQSGEIDVEVSSPGAERELRLPTDLDRFQELPMKVQYEGEGGQLEVKVLELVGLEEEAGSSRWKLADVKANSPGKGRRLSKKMREQQIVLPVACLKKVNLHIDY